MLFEIFWSILKDWCRACLVRGLVRSRSRSRVEPQKRGCVLEFGLDLGNLVLHNTVGEKWERKRRVGNVLLFYHPEPRPTTPAAYV